ncbi:MAG: nucleotidyl transferase AbiEii/AbiGii toxin family protein [Ignavibacteria bacterium]
MLYRISISPFANCFILKGALLFLLYNISRMRPTKDIDLMGSNIQNDLTTLKNVFKEIAAIESDDGLIFDPQSITTERIIEDGNYKGIRIGLEVKLDKARDRIQIDILLSSLTTQ